MGRTEGQPGREPGPRRAARAGPLEQSNCGRQCRTDWQSVLRGSGDMGRQCRTDWQSVLRGSGDMVLHHLVGWLRSEARTGQAGGRWARWIGRNWARVSYALGVEPTWLEVNRHDVPV